MSYETKISQSQIVSGIAELYEITISDRHYYYTSYCKDVVFDGKTFIAIPIERSNFARNTKLHPISLSVNVPLTEEFKSYIAVSPAEFVYLIIYSVIQDGSTENYKLFDGRMKEISFSENIAHVTFESSTQIFQQKLPKIVYQSRCNHSVFDSGCKLLENVWKVTAIVNVSGVTLISATFAAYPNGYFTQGHVKFGSDARLITNHQGSTIWLQVPFDARVTNGSEVSVWPGCDKAASTCKLKFNNFDNFLGFPYIPDSNPTIWGI